MQKRNVNPVDTLVSSLMTQVGTKTFTELLAEAVQEGAALGKREERRLMTEHLQHEADAADPLVKLLTHGKPRRNGLKMKAKRVVTIVCPVPGCTNRGIRPQKNFCQEHSKALTAPQKDRLRAQQIKDQAKAHEADIAARAAERSSIRSSNRKSQPEVTTS